MIRQLVHDHGPAEGPGLGCPEQIIDGQLRGACLFPGQDVLVQWLGLDLLDYEGDL